jgi:uncharacterized protein (TIGR03000 family)
MYSVVLAVAIAAAPATTSWQRGCGCYSSCRGCYGGCHGCYGSNGYTGYGCTTSGGTGRHAASPDVVLYGGAGAAYGYHGGCYGAGYASNSYFDPAMSGCTGCYGAYGGHSGYGIPVPAVPEPKGGKPVEPFPPLESAPKKEPKGAEDIAPPKEVKPKSSTAPNLQNQRAIVRVEIPDGGKLYVDGKHIDVPAGTRVFQTPELAPGQRYFYDIKIEVEIAGIVRKDEQRVIVERGQDVAVDFPSLRSSRTQTARQQE